MALVLFFVRDPAKGVAEMVRVVRPGGAIAAYLWDLPGGGFPMEPVQAEMRTMGFPIVRPPSADASRMDVLRGLWTVAGLEQIETWEITVQRSFTDFDDLWATCLLSPSVAATLATMASGDVDRLRERLHARLPADAAGRITYGARANAIKGRVPTQR
jgi:SAM-dependent methyltransferase